MIKPERVQEIDRVFESALELAPEDRERFLDEACADDPELRAEVASLLAAHEQAGDFIKGSAADVAARLLAKHQQHGVLGGVVGEYQIEGSLGVGGMGEVYLAKDKLGRKVALKLLRRQSLNDSFAVARFQQEARTLLALNHPNIVTLHDIGEINSIYYIASELVEGETLRQHLDKSELKLDDVLDIVIQTATALTAAHDKGIVHRDIKPENIMIRRDGYLKVLDFGIAKLTEGFATRHAETPAIRQVHTAEGTVVGTAPYMSPEQARGLEVDARTDIWSLGVVLYEAVSGRKPFTGDTTPDVITSILEKEPPPLARYANDVPETLEWIVARALRKDREARYQTASGLLHDLKELRKKIEFERSFASEAPPFAGVSTVDTRRGAAVIAGSTSSAEYVVGGIKRHKIAAITSLLLLLAGIVSLAAYLYKRNTDDSIESVAVLPFQNQSTEADTDYLSDGLAESLIYRLSQLPNLRVSPTSLVFAYKNRDIDPIKAGNQLGVNAVLSGRIVQHGDNLTINVELVDVRNNKLLWGEQYERTMSELLQTQRDIAGEIVEKLRLKVSREEKGLAKHYTESNEAFQLYLKGRFYWNKRTEEGMAKALGFYQQTIGQDPNFALAYSGIADCYALMGASDATQGGLSPDDTQPKSRAAALKALEIDQALAEPHAALGHVKYLYDHDWPGAEREFKQAIELSPNYAVAHQWYAIYLMTTGRFDQAETEARRAQELDPLSLPIGAALGWVLCTAGHVDQGLEQLHKTLDMDPNFTLAHYRAGRCYEQKQAYDEAIHEFRQASRVVGDNPQTIAALAHANALAGKTKEARTALAELTRLSQQRWVSPTNIGLIYVALGDKDSAFAWLDKAEKEHDLVLARLKVDSNFDSLRSDPRLNDLIQRMGIPP